MKKVLQLILHILGFPLLIAAVVLINLPIIQGGIGYGIFVFVGIIIAAVMTIIYYIAFLVNVKSKKKSKTSQTITLIVVVFVMLCGLWIVLDVALPNFLANATSNTIFYEDLVDNYEARSVVNQELLNEYITRNYNNGNLPDEHHGGLTLKEYKKQGYANEKVKKLLAIHFASIDGDGYASFVDPWIGMANDGRLTIPTLVHLLTDERELKNVDYALYDKELEELVTNPVHWDVLDMMGEGMGIDLDIAGILPGVYAELAPVLKTMIPGFVDKLSPGVATVVEEVLGAPIYISYDGETITLTPSNEARGVLGYQNMAWLNSNGLIYAIVTLLSVRNVFFIFGAWIILTNFIIGMLRGMGKEKKSKGKRNGGNSQSRPNGGGSYFVPGGYPLLDMGQITQNLYMDMGNGRQ